MALDFSTISTFSFEGGQLFKEAFLSMRSLEAGSGIFLLPEIAYKEKLNILDINPVAMCTECATWSGSGTQNFIQREIEVETYTWTDSMCLDKFKKYWTSKFMQSGANVETFNLESEVVDQYMKAIQAQVETYFWQGNAACGQSGVTTHIKAEVAGGSITSLGNTSASAVTSNNIMTAITAMINAAPSAILDKPIKIYMNFKTGGYFRQYLQLNGMLLSNSIGINGQPGDNLTVPGHSNIQIFETGGLADNNMILSTENNIVLGTDLVSDFTGMKTWYENKDDSILMRAKARLGAQIIVPGQIIVNFL